MDSVPANAVPAKESGGFTSHCVHLAAGPSQFTVRALKMQGSTMLIINPKGLEVFEELAVVANAPGSQLLALPSGLPEPKVSGYVAHVNTAQ